MKSRIFKSYDVRSPLDDTLSSKCALMGHFDYKFSLAWGYWMQQENVQIIIPLRHPARCLASFNKRNTINSTYESYCRQWDTLISMTRKLSNIMYLHLDDKVIRDKQAKAILEVIGLSHDVDWSVATETGSKHGTHEIEISDTLLENVPEKFINFYNSKM